MDAGGLSREWMTLLMKNIFSTEDATPSPDEDEERFVMRIDHLTPTSDESRSNVKYYKDDSLSCHHISDLFVHALLSAMTNRYTSHGYLPNPLVNYDLRQKQLDNGEARCVSDRVAQNLHFIGRLIGRAVFDGIPLGVHLNPLLSVVRAPSHT